MPINLAEERPINPGEEGNRGLLENLQGNILKAHGRDHVHLLLIRFAADKEKLHKWIHDFTEARVTSMRRQLAEIEDHRKGRETGVFGSLFLTAAGYGKLGFSQKQIAGGLPDSAFTVGMAASSAELGLNDPDPASWEEAYRPAPDPIDAMVLLAADRPALLQEVSREDQEGIAEIGSSKLQKGKVLREEGEDGMPIEPFGYVDGRSQPVFLEGDFARERDQGVDPWNPIAPPGLVLVPDPFSRAGDSFGSFLVYRKLEQNASGFEQRADAVANGGDARLAGAQIVGRFRNGTPVVSGAEAVMGSQRLLNHFDYSGPAGERCPVQAHIRNMNPRTANGRERRIVRRGIPYNELTPVGGSEGMLFMCFQADIREQFAFLQGRIAAATNDNFREFITLRGGEFFFAPSIPFLLDPAPPSSAPE